MDNNRVGEIFIEDLKALLAKHNAVMEANNDFLRDAPFGQDIRIMVNFAVNRGGGKWERVEMNLGRFISLPVITTMRRADINGFDALSTGDLILCANLLESDAKEYEGCEEFPKHMVESRRSLARKLKDEVNRRDQEILANLS